MGRENVQRPTRKITPSTTPVASVNKQTVPVQAQTQRPQRPQKPQHSRTAQVQHQNKQQVHPIQTAASSISKPVPEAHAALGNIIASRIEHGTSPIQRGESLEGYHQRIDPIGYASNKITGAATVGWKALETGAEGIMQYGGTEQQPEIFTSDPKPSPRGTTVSTVDGQVTATDKSFSLKEGEYGTLTDTGTVPIRHIEQEPMSMTHAQPPPDLTPAEEKVPNASIVTASVATPNLKDINSFKQTFEHPFGQPTGHKINPKQDKKRKGYYTDVELGYFDPPEKDIIRGTSGGKEYAFYYTGRGDRDDWSYSQYNHVETSPWQWYTGEEKVMGAKVVEKKHDSPLMISGWWERKGQPVVYEGGQYDDWKMLQQERATNKKHHDKVMVDFFNVEKKQRRKDKFFSHHLEDPNKKKVFDIGGWWH